MIGGWLLPLTLISLGLLVASELLMPGSTGTLGRMIVAALAFLGMWLLVLVVWGLIGSFIGEVIVFLALIVGCMVGLSAGADAASRVWHRRRLA